MTAGRDERTDGAIAARSIPLCRPAASFPTVMPMPVLIGVEAAVAHRGWTAARQAVLEALRTTQCVVVLMGARGGGKTLLLAELARALTMAETPVIQRRWGDPDVEQALENGAIPPDRLVLIDEADRLDEEALGLLIARNRGGLLLARCRDLPAGVRELARTLEQRVTIVPLAPLAPGETAGFLTARLVRAGRPPDLIGPEAVARIEAWSAGVPRLVNMLATAALFLATQERAVVTAVHVDEAAEMFSLHAVESAGTATDPAGLRSPESVPAATSALEPGPVLEGAGSGSARRVGIAGTPSPTELLPGVDVQQPGAAVEVLERPLPGRRARRAHVVRNRIPMTRRQWGQAAAAAVLLVVASDAATMWYAAHLPERAEIASATIAVPSVQLLAPAPAAVMDAEAAAVPPQPATLPALPPPAPFREANAALPETLLNAPSPALALTVPSFDRAATVETAPPIAVPSPPPPAEPAIRGASAELPNGPPSAAAPQPPRATPAGAAPAAVSAPERVASLTLHSGRGSELNIRAPAAPPRSAQVATRGTAPVRSLPTAEPASGDGDRLIVALGENHVGPTPRGQRSPVQQLVQARRALAANDAHAARELLESAETVIAFQAGVAPERAGMAAAHITDALASLNAGQATGALPHLERAIAVIRSPS